MGRQLLASLLVLFGCLASGTLECSRIERTAVQQHGAEIYGRMCAVCHGRSGEGYKADQAPAIAHPDFLASVTDDYIRVAVVYGRPGTTMSAWATERGGPLGRADVEAVIAYMRTWERHPRAKLNEGPLTGDAMRGADTFARECARCHGARGSGGPYLYIGNSQLLITASNGFLRHAVRHGRPGTLMAGFESTLGDGGAEDVVALLRSWQVSSPLLAKPPPAVRPPPIPLGPVPLNPKGPEPAAFQHYPTNTPADVIKAQLDRGARMGLLDARPPSDYTNEHIAGAVSVPFYDPDPYFAALPKDAWLVCYCACPAAESGQLAQKLMAHGFPKVTVLAEGLGTWRMRKYGTHTGQDP